MHGKIDCESCIHATHNYTSSGYSCTNYFALKCMKQIDKYNCIFCDAITDDYISDMDKVSMLKDDEDFMEEESYD